MSGINWPTQSVRSGAYKASLCRELINIVNNYGLEQMVEKPTRKKNILGLFFTKNSLLVLKSTTIPGISDHDRIPLILLNTKPTKSNQERCTCIIKPT